MSGKREVANRRRVRGASDMIGRRWRKCDRCGKKATRVMTNLNHNVMFACEECARKKDDEWFAKVLANSLYPRDRRAVADAGAVPRRGSDVGTSPLLGGEVNRG